MTSLFVPLQLQKMWCIVYGGLFVWMEYWWSSSPTEQISIAYFHSSLQVLNSIFYAQSENLKGKFEVLVLSLSQIWFFGDNRDLVFQRVEVDRSELTKG